MCRLLRLLLCLLLRLLLCRLLRLLLCLLLCRLLRLLLCRLLRLLGSRTQHGRNLLPVIAGPDQVQHVVDVNAHNQILLNT